MHQQNEEVTVKPEISRDQAIRSLLSKEKFADITLKGNDGRLVKAQRAMLSVRSPVFEAMLYGNFT
jgi:hypothetical protein